MKKYRTILTILVLLLIPLLFTTTGSAQEQYPEYPIPPVEKPANFLETFTYPRDYLLGLNAFPQADAGLPPADPMIIGGSTYTPTNLYPWLVSHQFQGVHFCGGTLIAPQWVLTAAHCWVDADGIPFKPSQYDVIVLGEYDVTDTTNPPTHNEQIIPIADAIIHPLFEHATPSSPVKFDFALLKLATPAILNDYVQVIDLVSPAMGNIETTNAKIMGWGATTYGGADTTTPRHATVSVLADSVCASAYGIWYDATYALCGGLADGSADTCQGDSGGPIVIDDGGTWKQAGVTSWGYQCGVAGYPGVYSRVSYAYSWIKSYLTPTRGDYNGDGTTDIAVLRNGRWFIKDVGNFTYGLTTDVPVPGDYDGDGKTDIAIYRDGKWFIKDIGNFTYGIPGDIPVPADYDGDGATDIAIRRGGKFYIMGVGNYSWGLSTDIPVPGDYDGDGVDDIAVFRDGKWFIMGIGTINFGIAGDIPIPADYDGDGTTDIAIRRGGRFYIMGIGNFAWGLPSDVPVPGDYDGNGTADIAVFRDGKWFIKDIGNINYGIPGDYPLPAPDTNADGDPYW